MKEYKLEYDKCTEAYLDFMLGNVIGGEESSQQNEINKQ